MPIAIRVDSRMLQSRRDREVRDFRFGHGVPLGNSVVNHQTRHVSARQF